MKHEIAFDNHENGMAVARMLLEEHYVVMLSYEENLLIVNYEYSTYSDRNDIVFMRKDEYEELEDKICDDMLNDIAADIKAGYDIESILGNRLK